MEEEEKEGIGEFVPLKARAYHINQQAIDICNAMERQPVDTIIALAEWVEGQKSIIQEKENAIRDLKSVVPTDGRPIYTLEEFGDVMRKVTQAEGVMLHEKQKGFFRELFASLTQCISDKGLMGK